MGNDAAKGAKAVKAAGGYVLAQDEATSMILGMPAEAIKTGAVDEVLGLGDISAAIERRVAKLCRAFCSCGSAMKFAVQEAAKSRRGSRPEQVILFSVGNQMFVIAADSVQEIRSADSLAGAAHEIEQPEMGESAPHDRPRPRTYYVVNAAAHFGLPATRPALVLILRQLRVAVLVDRIERMTEISAVYPLPRAFTGEDSRGIADWLIWTIA